jgi:major membrane immunogen (membrane-anchored lipoprotein)
VYPIKNSIKLKRSASAIGYRNEMEYETDKGKIKTLKLDFKLKPIAMKGQDKNEFKTNTAKVFDAIAGIIGAGGTA